MHTTPLFSDECKNLGTYWNYGTPTSWSANSSGWPANYYFQGHYSSGSDTARLLTLKNSKNLGSYAPGTVIVSWKQRVSGAAGDSDRLEFSLSSDNGSSWSDYFEAFRGNIGSSWVNYYYFIPQQYLASNFKLRFYLVGFGTGKSCEIDDIRIDYLPSDTSVTFKINDQQYFLDVDGTPKESGQITTSNSQIFPNIFGGSLTGFSYACHRNITELVKKYPVVPGETHHTGNAKYTVGDVQANAGHDLSYAGWSLIIVYSSPATTGHYLYLRDVFSFNPGTSVNLDFDGDGQPGGDITNFIIPEPIRDKFGNITETVAAKLTCFVGEGDEWRIGDYVKITGDQSGKSKCLSNDKSPADNVWNGKSPDLAFDGIDIDTFKILWSEDILRPKDTKLHLDMYSGDYDGYSNRGDAFNLIYLILSIRSETTTSGAINYLING